VVEEYRGQINGLRNEIATLERRQLDNKYAAGLLVEAAKNLDLNNFQLALQNTQDALSRDQENGFGVYLQSELQRILNDPLEQELRRQETQNKERQRSQKKEQLVADNLKLAREKFSGKQYDDAITHAQRALALAPTNAKDVDSGQKIIDDAEELKRKIALQVMEVKRLISESEFKSAASQLKKLKKLAPSHAEIAELEKQLKS